MTPLEAGACFSCRLHLYFSCPLQNLSRILDVLVYDRSIISPSWEIFSYMTFRNLCQSLENIRKMFGNVRQGFGAILENLRKSLENRQK